MFDDYNNDGSIDFTVGQYTHSSATSYKLYTIHKKDGQIEQLTVNDYDYISSDSDQYSVKFNKSDGTTFIVKYYFSGNIDNPSKQASYYERYFTWKGNKFILLKEEKVS